MSVDLTDLIARVEAGEGADRGLLHDAWNALAQIDREFRRFACTTIDPMGTTQAGRFAMLVHERAFLDAAALLLPDGWGWQTGSSACGGYARLVGLDEQGISQSHAKTPVRALLAAILRAKETGQ